MTQEEKDLLLKDLCCRLPYGVHLFTNSKHHVRLLTIGRDLDYDEQYWINGLYDIDEVKPYLRPMSSMTEEETKELLQISNFNPDIDDICYDSICVIERTSIDIIDIANFISWLNAHHFDYRGLIPMGIALEAPEGMYNIKQNNYGNY